MLNNIPTSACELHKIQARLTDILWSTSTRAQEFSLDSIPSFAGSINTKKAYKKFCMKLYQIGVTSDMKKKFSSPRIQTHLAVRNGHTDISRKVLRFKQ